MKALEPYAKYIKIACWILLVVTGLNVGIVAITGIDLLGKVLCCGIIHRIFYILVGVAAALSIYAKVMGCKCGCCCTDCGCDANKGAKKAPAKAPAKKRK